MSKTTTYQDQEWTIAKKITRQEYERQAIEYALCRYPQNMLRGFVIHTNYGDWEISQEDAAPFAKMLEKLLQKKLKQFE
jgi:hypothetical protein